MASALNKNMKFYVVAALIAAATSAKAGPGSNVPASGIAFDSIVAEAHQKAEKLSGSVPGMAVAVAVDGEIVWSDIFGYADLTSKRPVTRTTRFRIGSISKSLSAVGLMRMVERDQIDLDAPIRTYAPSFPVKPQGPISARQLAGHLAGIRHYRDREPWMNQRFYSSVESLIIFRDDHLLSIPGTEFHYSTYGWTLLGAVMESAAHQNFLEYMQFEVFGPFGLNHTIADQGQIDETDGTVYYEQRGNRFVLAPTVDLSPTMAGGGFLSTAEDLVNFGSALLRPGLLEESSLATLFSAQKTVDGKSTGYGVGWYISGDSSGPVYYHTGSSHGGTASLLIRPKSRVVIAIACNVSESDIINDSMLIGDLFAPPFSKKPKNEETFEP